MHTTIVGGGGNYEEVEEEIMNLDGDSVKELYLVLEKKYGYSPTSIPKFK